MRTARVDEHSDDQIEGVKDQKGAERLALRLDALPDVLTVVEFARLMRIGRNSAYEAIRRGDVGSVRIGRRVVVPRTAVLALLRNTNPS